MTNKKKETQETTRTTIELRHTQIVNNLFIYLIRQMAANSKIHNEHKS